VIQDYVYDSFDALAVIETGHWSSSTSHFPERPFNHIRCAKLLPHLLWASKEVEKLLQISIKAFHDIWRDWTPDFGLTSQPFPLA
jgi:hypothetical protein